jgi:octaprenyl-diphosphate synthase
MENASAGDRKMIRSAIEADGLERLAEIQAVIDATGALHYTAARAQEAADLAIDSLSALPESEHRQALVAIAEFAVKRRS